MLIGVPPEFGSADMNGATFVVLGPAVDPFGTEPMFSSD
jgi:hypothetical protein